MKYHKWKKLSALLGNKEPKMNFLKTKKEPSIKDVLKAMQAIKDIEDWQKATKKPEEKKGWEKLTFIQKFAIIYVTVSASLLIEVGIVALVIVAVSRSFR